jgi:peptidoglycan/LPS O-acetylase OafA/YrhL
VSRAFSLYLDLVRLLAALLVVQYHANSRLLSSEKLPWAGHGHAAVIVFFVLSGYVIAHVAGSTERRASDYWASRLARFYALAVPAMLLTPLLDVAGEALAPHFYGDKTTHTLAALRIVISLLFANELWGWSVMAFSNVPYWSLCYEMAYYTLFAIATFTGGRRRAGLLVLAMLVLGPKILLLAPLWLLGVVLQRWRRLHRLQPWQGWVLFLLSWPAYALFQHSGMTAAGAALAAQLLGPELQHTLACSKFAITDYLLALIVAANFAGFRVIAGHFTAPLWACAWLIRPLAKHTFALYILHQPLLLFYAALLNGDPAGHRFYGEVLAATLLTAGLIGAVTECYRPWLRARLGALLRRGPWRPPAPATLPHGGR